MREGKRGNIFFKKGKKLLTNLRTLSIIIRFSEETLNGRQGDFNLLKENHRMDYEYVTRAEYQPVRIELEEIIHRAQRFLKENYKITFQYRLIGSGRRHLITRIKGGNSGYDFDYNLVLQGDPKDFKGEARLIKKYFMEAFRNAIKGTSYNPPEDSTSVITIKVVDRKKSKLLHKCDFAIVYYPNVDTDDGYMYLKNLKNGMYTFEQRVQSRKAEKKLKEILKVSKGWQLITDEYLKVKRNNNDPDKHSYILYLETINNVFNHIKQVKS